MLRQLQCSASVRFFLPPDIMNVVANPVCKQSVRWRRKPPGTPLAKSKLFRIPPRPQVPEEERIELFRLTTNYNTFIKSVREFLREEVQSAAGKEQLADAVSMDDDLIRCKEINDKWNAEVALIREKRLLHEKEEKLNLISKRLEERKTRERNRVAEINELVRMEKEKEKYYITSENIDEAIENALRGEVDYNFAIDVKGNIYKGEVAEENLEKKAVETV
ncbi:Probable 28S ribosomal protein S26, mitochondrial [Gryllus bimaculatus]|nr:Probable 28S ribosomal protein S26, mitochondrial [Gryllus bimaculatus]